MDMNTTEFSIVKMNLLEVNVMRCVKIFGVLQKEEKAKFNGCSSEAFVLHLKECEFRYNHRNDDLFKI